LFGFFLIYVLINNIYVDVVMFLTKIFNPSKQVKK